MTAKKMPQRTAVGASPPAPRWRGRLRLLAGSLLGVVAFLGAGAWRPAVARPGVPNGAAGAPAAAPEIPAEPGGEAPRGPWRDLSPAQRQAIRQLSREQREALAARPGGRHGGAAPPGARLSARERRELRDVIREEHERHGQGGHGGKRY